MARIPSILALGLMVAPILWSATMVPAQASALCGAPVPLDDNWKIDTPDAAGFDLSRLCGVAEMFQDADDVHSVVVARHGRLVFEHYLAG